MPLFEEQIGQFNEQGFLPYPELLTPLEVVALHQRLEDIGNSLIDFPERYVQIEPQVDSGELESNPVRFNNVRKIWNLTRHDAMFGELARQPRHQLAPGCALLADGSGRLSFCLDRRRPSHRGERLLPFRARLPPVWPPGTC